MFIVIQSQPCHDILFSTLSPKREVASHEGKVTKNNDRHRV